MYYKSFSEMLGDPNERDRILTNYVHKGQKIKNFGEFKQALLSEFDKGKGNNAMIDEDDIIKLFESDENKFIMGMYLEDEEKEKLFGDGILVKRESISDNKMIVVVTPKIKYVSRGKTIERSQNKSWYKKNEYGKNIESSELKFLKERKLKKISTKQILNDYNKHFKNSTRTKTSIKSKLRRI